MKLRVYLADDHTMFRQGIRTMVVAENDMEVVGEASNAAEAVRAVTEVRPDVILMDVGMQGLSSFEATKQIKQARPETRIVFLTMYDDQDYLFQAMNSGASGYLLKDSPAPELITAIREVARGGTHLNGRMLSYLVSDFRSRTTNSTERSPRFDALTARERHVLKVLAEGMSVKEIAADLNLSVKTVEAHKFNLMRKLDIHNKAHLVTYAVQKKLITIPALG
jgi:two-component system, NarL family, response regulator NreC